MATVHRSPWLSLGSIVLGTVLVVGDFFLLSWWFARGGWGAAGFLAVLALGTLAATRAGVEWSVGRLIVTNQRALAVAQQGLLSRSVSEVPLERLQDVRFAVTGIRATLFRYGTLTIEVAGGSAPVQLPGMPKPEALQELLGRLAEERRAELTPGVPAAGEPRGAPAASRRPRVDALGRGV